jgi:hypothetical protein
LPVADSIPDSTSPAMKARTLLQENIRQEPVVVNATRKLQQEGTATPPQDITTINPNRTGYNRYYFVDTTSRKFSYEPVETFISAKGKGNNESDQLLMKEFNHQRAQLNWALIIGMVSIFLLLFLKRYYRKFISQVVSTLVNYQLAEKMLREKNIIVRRAFFILNFNFLLVLSLFLLTLTLIWDFQITQNIISDYFIILGIVAAVILARLILLYIAGFLFGNLRAVKEHAHITFLVNKNLGLIILPAVFIILYTTAKISEIVIYLCLGLLVIATFYKIFRGFQIIIRNGVLIFYAFLYLCTLELLPLVLGSKLIMSLR